MVPQQHTNVIPHTQSTDKQLEAVMRQGAGLPLGLDVIHKVCTI